MKNYQKFINEHYGYCNQINNNISLKSFMFAIDIRNSKEEEIDGIFKEIRKYFIIPDKDKQKLINEKAWCWRFDIHIVFNEISLRISVVTTPGWGAGWQDMENIITPKEFLNFGLKGVEEYIGTKTDMIKYNL